MTQEHSINNYHCPICGGMLVGDGHTVVRHCENVDVPMDVEPDAPTIYCEKESEEEGE